MGHEVKGILRSYWSTAEQFCKPFYTKEFRQMAMVWFISVLQVDENHGFL
jgi:hypothetical protein